MTLPNRVVVYCLFPVCIFLFSACSSLSPLQNADSRQSVAHNQEDTGAPTAEEMPYLEIEPEQHLAEELAALEKTGAWEPGNLDNTPPPVDEVTFDFPITINKQVQFYLDQFQGKQRRHFSRWLARSTQYQEDIETELQKAGLPLDLVYLAMIESGFNPSAYSYAHAAGLWQFIRGTGRNYGLRIDSWVDERREPKKSTQAAIKYLSFLHNEFGDWYLAVAAYNAGEGKIGRAIKKYKTRDFWQLAGHRYLALETKRYVPKLIAAIIIAREPAKYGFTDIPYKKPTKYDTIKLPPATDLAAVAVTAATSVKKLRKLNNELRKNQTPPGKKEYLLRIPEGSKELVAQNLDRLHPVITTAYKTHKVRKGDTITGVCRKYKINKTILLKANNLRTASLKRGQRLRIPYRTTKYVLLAKGETPESRFASAGKDGKMILHTLKRGETLSKIAKQYDVPVRVIMQWNDIKNVRKIRAGHHLALFLDNGVSSFSNSMALTNQPNKGSIITLNDQKKWPGSNTGGDRIWYKVRNGDSLWTIAKKFQVSARQLRQWNNLANNLIHPGTKLVIKNG